MEAGVEMAGIRIVQSIPKVESYLELRRAVGWPLPDPGDAALALAHSRLGFLVLTEERAIGMALVQGDGFLSFFIQDVIIHPDWQRRGLGTRLMDAVMDHIEKHARKTAYIGLFAGKGLERFYSRYGFIQRPTEAYGAGMFLMKGVVEGSKDGSPRRI